MSMRVVAVGSSVTLPAKVSTPAELPSSSVPGAITLLAIRSATLAMRPGDSTPPMVVLPPTRPKPASVPVWLTISALPAPVTAQRAVDRQRAVQHIDVARRGGAAGDGQHAVAVFAEGAGGDQRLAPVGGGAGGDGRGRTGGQRHRTVGGAVEPDQAMAEHGVHAGQAEILGGREQHMREILRRVGGIGLDQHRDRARHGRRRHRGALQEAIGVERHRRIDAGIARHVAARRGHAPRRGDAAVIRIVRRFLGRADRHHADDQAGLVLQRREIQADAVVIVDAETGVRRIDERVERQARRIAAGDRMVARDHCPWRRR